MNKLFKDPAHIIKASNLIVEAAKLSTFADNALYNPFRGKFRSYEMKLMEVVGTLKVNKEFKKFTDYNIVTVTDTRTKNILSGRTKVTDGVVAGTFLYTATHVSKAQCVEDWDRFVNDHKTSLIPANIDTVYSMIIGVMKTLPLTKPDVSSMASSSFHTISMWEYDLQESALDFCEAPRRYEVYKDPAVYKQLKEATGRRGTSLSRMINLKSNWRVGDGLTAMCWCIASAVHPVRLLNFMGYYLTHRGGQPKTFASKYARTQLHEVPVMDTRTGAIIEYKTATSKFSTGFLNEFARMIQEVDFKNNPIDEDFIALTLRFELEDFAMADTLEWQSVPLSEDAKEYYAAMGITEENFTTAQELDQKKYKRGSTKLDSKKLEATGNPLFDIAMQSTEE